jgi:GntR family transcriptional regulator
MAGMKSIYEYIRYARQKELVLVIVISAESSEPMYRQLMEQVKEAIANGSLLPGTKLPSIREMSQKLKVSTITIKRAYSDLEKEGYLVTRMGLGSFVAGISRDELRAEKIGEIRKEIERIVAAAEKIGISAGDIAAIVSEIRRAGGEQSRIEKPKTGMADGIA